MPENTETTDQQKPSKLRKCGPAIFWGTIVALPAMNMTAAILNYRTAKMQIELETLKVIAEKVKEI